MQISLEIVDPRDNTNTPHGVITLSTDSRYTYIKTDNGTIAVDSGDLYRAISTLYR